MTIDLRTEPAVAGSFAFRLALLLVAGCSERETPPPTPPAGSGAAADVVRGTLTIDDQPVTDLACRPGAAVHIFVDVVTSAGTLRFHDGALAWNGEPLTCEQLDRSWGGGRREDNAAYWRGTLAFRCIRGAQRIAGSLELDCGGITAEERAQLDAQRDKARGR